MRPVRFVSTQKSTPPRAIIARGGAAYWRLCRPSPTKEVV
ncbi:hypothetical protein GCWU000325_02113 [Alloprevotella tannerae ATCC 51259]|uniref:Uncharacterized protein n=1 Tax=Alloprevotella tannerae ATCC 51259 TaxID=626522 RepID=C9LIQ4_9BACT|nr:hypothetical protein GCWU000325_02113 [Alloprevotella tannerae ATCC 51259]